MMLASFNKVCQAVLHLTAIGCALASVYFFFGPHIELIMIALLSLGAAVAFEVIAAVVADFIGGGQPSQ